ncbi:autotransporter domain-containing protein [Salmonella enterica]|nr:autotransporter domain-containing protein [Salmonella enterica]HCJ1004100.1 autotransporter domain-containing protein [Salmonella enterica]
MISRPNQNQHNLLVRTDAKGWNTENSVINTANNSGKAVLLNGANALFVNDGKINVTGNNGVAVYAEFGSNTAVNNGTITLGEAGNPDAATGMVGMLLGANTAADSVMENNGTIQINANNSFAFSKEGNNGRIINNGIVSIADGVTGSGIIKQPGLADSIESGVNVDYTRPDMPTGKPGVNVIEGYTIGTTASGHAGKLSASNALLKDVTVNTGFAAGTADRSVTFDNVVTGKNIQGAGNIRSESIVWNAQGKLNDKGNVDVTMTKNNYADVAGDGNVTSVANALDKAYTNNALFSSLNVKTAQELSQALRQVSGSQATTAFNDARVLSSRFDRLAADAKIMGNGLAFNAMSRNDQRAELGNKVRYDMFALNDSQNIELGYGIARLNGSGTSQAGDNGLTGGWSQFLSLKHRLNFGEDYSWSNSLRYDRHELKSNRLIRYGDVNKVASAQNRQQYMEYRTEGSKHIPLADGLNLTPSLGLKLRHTVNGALTERGAGDFNLGLNSSMETAVDSVVGLKLDYIGKDGWGASAKLEGGPNLSYTKSQRTGMLQGAKGVSFNLDDGQKGGGLNRVAEVSVNYSKDNKSLSASAFQWQEDGIQDKGFMLNYNVSF